MVGFVLCFIVEVDVMLVCQVFNLSNEWGPMLLLSGITLCYFEVYALVICTYTIPHHSFVCTACFPLFSILFIYHYGHLSLLASSEE